MARQRNQWGTRHGLCSQDGTYRLLPTTATTSLPILNLNNFPEITNPDFVWGHISASEDSCWYVGQDWVFSYHCGDIFNPLYRVFHIWYGSQLARLYGLTRWFYEGEVFTERSFENRNEQDLFCRLLGRANPFFNENELDWDTFDLRTAATVHDHESWNKVRGRDYRDNGGARSTCSARLYHGDQAARLRHRRRHSFCY